MVETEGVEEFLANSAQTKLTAVPQGQPPPSTRQSLSFFHFFVACVYNYVYLICFCTRIIFVIYKKDQLLFIILVIYRSIKYVEDG
jgi:hypothetical protein